MHPDPIPDYSHFTVSELALDEAFRQWVFQPDEQSMTFWHAFMLRHPEKQTTVDEAASILLHLRVRYDDLTETSQQRIGQLLAQAAREKLTDKMLIDAPVRPLHDRRWLGLSRQVAASLIGFLLLAGGAFWYSRQPHEQRIHTAFGETRSVTLPDGSTVLLNGNSTLTFANRWADDDDQARQVWIDGEGYFRVTKKRLATGSPIKFVTHTPTLDISVMGTQFNVNTRRGSTAVMLVEGRVRLNRPGQTGPGRITEMKPGQLASTQPDIDQVTVRTEKAKLHTAWTQHEFVFENTTLGEIARQLHDTYGLTVVLEDADLANRRFTGNLTDQSVETLLTTISLTFDLQVERDSNRVVLRNTQ